MFVISFGSDWVDIGHSPSPHYIVAASIRSFLMSPDKPHINDPDPVGDNSHQPDLVAAMLNTTRLPVRKLAERNPVLYRLKSAKVAADMLMPHRKDCSASGCFFQNS
jgi:hypothetical protein